MDEYNQNRYMAINEVKLNQQSGVVMVTNFFL
jgi:hypothetical protein